ncbi:hypothetical protein ACH4PU_10720 [Streptomyces sp. NPDC021100]|uniref:hypothetical protein n=1 Tax=Streptomyces sp. NPDC021100 TaxID=3365114 RepID=UPI0037902A6B
MRRTGWGARSRAGALVAGVLLCAAACGGGGGGGTDSGVAAGAGATGKPASRAGAALDAGTLRKALPTLRSLPPGWRAGNTPPRAKEVPRARWCAEGVAHGDCSLFHGVADVQYKAPGDSGSVVWTLFSYPDRKAAATAFGNRKKTPRIAMPQVGDESTAYSVPAARYATPGTDMVVRVGTVIAQLTYQDADKDKDSAQVLLALARAQADRLQRAERNAG